MKILAMTEIVVHRREVGMALENSVARARRYVIGLQGASDPV
jgi:hypothetical protein